MSPALTRLLDLPIRHPRATVGVIVLLTILLGWFAVQVRVDSAIENLLPTADPERLYYDEVVDVFGSEEATVVGIFASDVFHPDVLARIDRLSKAIAEIDAVREVLSLTTMKGVESTDFGVEIGPLMRELPTDEASADAFRKRVYDNPIAVGNLVLARRQDHRRARTLRSAHRRGVHAPRHRGPDPDRG